MYFPVNSGSGEYPVVEAEGQFVLVPKNYYTLYAGTVEVDVTDEAVMDRIKAAVPRMERTMRMECGVAIASCQVGLRERFFVLDSFMFGTDKPIDSIYINPKIIAASHPKLRTREGCLSHPDITYFRDRHPHVTMQYTDIHGKPKSIDTRHCGCPPIYRRLLAQAFQHEIDHLDGLDVRDGKMKKFNEEIE